MDLTIDAAKGIFDLLDDEEEIGILMFDSSVETIEPLTEKKTLDRESLFNRLDTIRPRGGTNFEIALTAAVAMIEKSSHSDRNKRIIFLTDANPTVGGSSTVIRELSERAFVASKGFLGISYFGIGLSFNAEACAELSRVHSSSVCTISNRTNLAETLKNEFNYLVSPIAFDVEITLSSQDYSISEVFGGDSDCHDGEAKLSFRTMTASSVGAQGVKGSAVIIHLTSRGINDRSLLHVNVKYTPFGTSDVHNETYDYLLNDDPTLITEKAFALSVSYRTLQTVLPEGGVSKEKFNQDEETILVKLRNFLRSQQIDIVSTLETEIGIVDRLISNHCQTGNHSKTVLIDDEE
jgi:Ca-activated chloride channel family protein